MREGSGTERKGTSDREAGRGKKDPGKRLLVLSLSITCSILVCMNLSVCVKRMEKVRHESRQKRRNSTEGERKMEKGNGRDRRMHKTKTCKRSEVHKRERQQRRDKAHSSERGRACVRHRSTHARGRKCMRGEESACVRGEAYEWNTRRRRGACKRDGSMPARGKRQRKEK